MSAESWRRRTTSSSCRSSSDSSGSTDQLRVLFDMTGFHGWEAGALWEDIKFDVNHFGDIERLAMVGETKWEHGMATFCKPFTKATIRYFDHADAAEARTWLGEALSTADAWPEARRSMANHGAVVSVRGSVVDVRFDERLAADLLGAARGRGRTIVIEVLAQRDARHVRGIALTPTQGLARGMAVEDTGGPLKAPVGKGMLSRMFDVFGNAIDREAALSDVAVAFGASGAAAAGATFHQVRDL